MKKNKLEQKTLRDLKVLRDESNSEDLSQNLRQLGLFGLVLGDLVGYTGGGFAFGYFLVWKKWEGPSWAVALFSLLGLCGGFYQVYRLYQRER
jgi:F0F1-type ATP synthase assembly protein I